MSSAAREAERQANAARQAERRANMSSAAREAERQADAARQAERLANMSSAAREAERQADATEKRNERNVTSLYWALDARGEGERERRLLFGVHASGSAFLTVNSRRLQTLEVGSKLHAQCTEDVSNDVERYCAVSITDQARMVRDFTQRATQAAALHVCATCGLRSPSMKYTDAQPLHELPRDHWIRIPDDAYIRLKEEGASMTLMKHGRDGTFARVTVARVDFHSCFESEDNDGAVRAFHVVPEAVEKHDTASPRIRMCRACHHGWSRLRGERVWKRPDSGAGEHGHCHDDLYWAGAPRNTIACGADLGRLVHLKETYGIDTAISRLEQLVLAEYRCHYVSYKIVAYGNEETRQRLYGHTICFPHAPQRLSTVTQLYSLAATRSTFKSEAFTKRLAATAGVNQEAVHIIATEAAHGELRVEVRIGPLSAAVADAVGDKLQACTAVVEDAGRAFGVTVKHIDEPCTVSHMWSFGEAVLRAALDSVTVQFVGPANANTNLDKFALKLYKENGDLQLRPHIIYNELQLRAALHGEKLPPELSDFEAIDKLITDFDVRGKIKHKTWLIHDCSIEHVAEASDIANVRVDAQSSEHRAVNGGDYGLTTHYGCLDRHEQQNANVLQGLVNTFGAARVAGHELQNDPGVKLAPPLVLERGAIPLDDYESGAEVLYKAFWNLFPLRRGLAPPEPVSHAQLRRMFCYYDARFAHDMSFLFHCANVAQRHAVNSAVAVKVISSSDAFADFNTCVNDKAFLRLLQRATANPKGEEARQVMRKVVSFINIAAQKVPWGMRERSAEVTNLIAGQRAHGAASMFYSCAPDDVHQPLAVRLSFAHEGYGIFPNAWTGPLHPGFLAALQGVTDEERVHDGHHMDEATLQKLAAVNPVASVLTFDALVENLRVSLLRHSAERPHNQPLPSMCDDTTQQYDGTLREHRKGIFGMCTLNRDVKECNKRAAMHEHGHAHGGLSPALLGDIAAHDGLRQQALDALDSQVRGELPLEYHALRVLQDILKVRSRRDAAFDIPTPDAEATFANTSEWDTYLRREWWPRLEHHAHVVVMNRHTHEHQATCASAGKDGKGKGRFMCRMCAPWGHDVEHTRCLELRAYTAINTAMEEGSDDLDMGVVQADSEPVQFYVQRRQVPFYGPQPQDWPAHLCHRQFLRVESAVSMVDGCAQLRDKVSEALVREGHRTRQEDRLHTATLFHVVGGAEVLTTLGAALAALEAVAIMVREPIEFRCRICYPHCLMGRQCVSTAEREAAIAEEDNMRDLSYHAYLPTPAILNGSDQRSLVVDIRRRLLPTEDDVARYSSPATRNELAVEVGNVRHHTCNLRVTDKLGPDGQGDYVVTTDEVIEKMRRIAYEPGQELYRLLQLAEFREHKSHLDRAMQGAVDDGKGLQLRRLLAAWTEPAFVCRNGIIADWNVIMAGCIAGNAVPLTLGAGSASKATAMYSIKYMGKDAYNISAAATVLHEAHKAVHDHPSSAKDKLTADRTAKHFCQHVVNHAAMELEATQAAGLVLGINSYGSSDPLDYHSAWDVIKVAACAASGKLVEEPDMADNDALLEDESILCRAINKDGTPRPTQVHPDPPNAGKELGKGDGDELVESDCDVAVSDSEEDDDDLLARDNVDAMAAAVAFNDAEPRAAMRRPQRDLLSFFGVDGGTKDGSCNVYNLADGSCVYICPAFHYSYRASQLHLFNPIEFRRRFKVMKMNDAQLQEYEWHSAAANFIWTLWLLRGRFAGSRRVVAMHAAHGCPPMRVLALSQKKAYDRWLNITALVVERKRPFTYYTLRHPHPLRHTHAIVPRTKWGVVALPGAPPPKGLSAGADKQGGPKAKVRERNVAKYFLSNFTSWTAWERPGERLQQWYLRRKDYKPFDYNTWRLHCELLALEASVALPRCSNTEKRSRCLQGVERMRWEDRVYAVLNVQTWVRLHILFRPRKVKDFEALRKAANVDVPDENEPSGWKKPAQTLAKEWHDLVCAASERATKGDPAAHWSKVIDCRILMDFANRRFDIVRKVRRHLVDEARRARFIAASRLFDIENVMSGFRAPKEATVLPTKHRGRACTYWKQDKRPSVFDGRWAHGKDERDAAAAINSLQRKADMLRGSTRDVSTRMNDVNQMKEQAKSLVQHLSSRLPAAATATDARLVKLWNVAARPQQRVVSSHVALSVNTANATPLPAAQNVRPLGEAGLDDAIIRYRQSPSAVDGNDGHNPFAPITDAEYEVAAARYQSAKEAGHPVGEPPLNVEQRAGARPFLEAAVIRAKGIRRGDSAQQIAQAIEASKTASTVMLVVGAGGTGKSAMVHALKRRMAEMGVGHLLVTAYTGVASAPFGGPTLLALMSLGITCKGARDVKQFKPMDVEAARTKFLNECGVNVEDIGGIVIDEISFIASSVFGHVDHALRALTGNASVSCGGIPLLLCGDNHQKPPPGDVQWYRELVESLENVSKKKRANAGVAVGAYNAKACGLQLLKLARRVELKRLMRARDDPTFIDTQQRMRQTDSQRPVCKTFLQGLRPVSESDVADDPEWRFAPVGVVSRHERDVINMTQVEAFARYFDTPLIRWKLPMLETLGDKDLERALYLDEPMLWGTFVEGAPVNLTENIKPVRKLVNGSPGLLDSLVLADGSDTLVRKCVRFDEHGKPIAWLSCTWADVRVACNFQLIELDEPPLAVNIRVGGRISPPGKVPGSVPGAVLWHGTELDDLSALITSVANGEQIIPLFASNNVKEGVELRGAVAAQAELPLKMKVKDHQVCSPHLADISLSC